MKKQHQDRLKAWELALLCALCLTLSAAVWAQGKLQRIEGGLIRLHVLAVSDEEEEQRIKLRVRDAVLSFLSPELETKLRPRAPPKGAMSPLRLNASNTRPGATAPSRCRQVSTNRCA